MNVLKAIVLRASGETADPGDSGRPLSVGCAVTFELDSVVAGRTDSASKALLKIPSKIEKTYFGDTLLSDAAVEIKEG